MLVHPWDAPNHDDEWRAVLHEFDFGQLIAPRGPDRDVPVVVPTHFVFDGERTLELHLARFNPVWRALAERPRALLTVVAGHVYVPAADHARTRAMIPRSGCRPATTQRFRLRLSSRSLTTRWPRRRSWPASWVTSSRKAPDESYPASMSRATGG
jgi:hypothetical protein